MSAVPNATDPSRKPRRWLRQAAKAAFGLVMLVFVAAIAGAVFQWASNSRDRRLNPPPGRLVDVGGYRMHLYCVGQGSPTVVLEAGHGDSWLKWYKVQKPLSQFTRVCAYDRAGLGWSDSSPKPRTSKVFAEELHTLLHNAAVPGPYLLAGHSMGGLTVRMYASLYPDEVAGMVLVDSVHPDQFTRFFPETVKSADPVSSRFAWTRATMPFGIPRLLGWCGSGPPELQSMLRTVECQSKSIQEVQAEWESTKNDASPAQVRATGPLGNLPLVVLSHDPDKLNPAMPQAAARAAEQAWVQMQDELATLSSNSSHIVATGSGHYIQLEKPEVVIEAVRKVVEQSRAVKGGG